MFIRCETGDWPDYYYIDKIESLEELQDYLNNNMPVMGKKVDYRHKKTMVLEEDCYQTLIYLNNYLNIYKSNLYFVTDEFLQKLSDEKCATCLNYCHYVGCETRYKPDEANMCGNYKEPKMKIKRKWLRFFRS